MKLIRKTNRPYFPAMFDDFFARDLFEREAWSPGNRQLPAVNIMESDTEWSIEVAAPGLKKEDFQVELEKDLLTVSFDKKEEEHTGQGEYKRKEFHQVSFRRSFNVPEGLVDTEAIQARYDHGILRLQLPKLAEAVQKAKRTISIG